MPSFPLSAPGLHNYPVNLQNIVQDGILIREFQEPLMPNLRFRACFVPMETDRYIGQTFTFSKRGDLPSDIEPINMASVSDSDLNSGLTPQTQPLVENYSTTISKWGEAVHTNLLAASVAIEDTFAANARALGRQAGKGLDKSSRRVLSQAYLGGNTFLTAIATATTTLTVDNIYGFTHVIVNGIPTPVSVGNPLAVKVNGVANTVVGYTETSLRTVDDHAEGTLTLSGAVTEAIGASVISGFAPAQLRPNGKTTDYNLAATDLPTMNDLLLQEATLESLNIPPGQDGFYYGYMDAITHTKLYQDSAFQQAFQSQGITDIYGRRALGILGNTMFFQTSHMPQGNVTTSGGTLNVKSTFVHGGEIGYEARYNGIDKLLNPTGMASNIHITMMSPDTYIVMQFRAPLDIHGEVSTASWKFLGNWVAATDSLSNDVSNAYYKRGVYFRHA